MRALAAAIGLCLTTSAGLAEDAAPRQIAPERFAPSLRDAPAVADRQIPERPTREKPLGNCDRKLRGWSVCLEATAQLADLSVDEEDASLIQDIQTRPGLNPLIRQGVTKAFSSAEESWRSLRDLECGELALIETGLGPSLFESRFICRIRRDIERVETLELLYRRHP